MLGLISRRLNNRLPPGGFLTRFAGDRFIVMLTHGKTDNPAGAVSATAEMIRGVLDEPTEMGFRRIRFTATMAAAIYPKDADSFDAMLQCLDAAMTVAKGGRQAGVLFFSAGMRDRLVGRMDLEQALRKALENREFVLHYQPVVDAHSRQVRSAESLMRWQRPGLGLQMPGAFIEVAEISGLIGSMGQWAVEECCRQMKEWERIGFLPRTINVNVSGVQLEDGDFDRRVCAVLEQSGIAPERLTLEVTETALIGRFDESVERLGRLRAHGIQVLIDDFGTGYASLKYLKELPLDGIKIDRLFVKNLPENVTDQSIVSALVSLARVSGYKLVAEGIETEAQAGLLAEAGVSNLQGFLFSKALPADEFRTFSSSRNSLNRVDSAR
jgi:EAL domain-containing protein (putative c-di-GMP-specific phosphodiesterase class I)